MEINKETLVVLNEDDKAVSLRALSKVFHVVQQLYERVKDNALTEEMRDVLFGLTEGSIADVATVLKYNSEAEQKIEERYKEIRQANIKIHELEQKLADNKSTDGLKELLYALHMNLNEWWKLQGFDLITDDSFGFWGYKGRFCLGTRHISFMSTHPVSEEKEIKNRLEQMIEEGYEFIEDAREYVLIDTSGNRDKITAMVKAKFPSLEISKWENWRLHGKEGFRLRSFEGYIRNLGELKALMDEIKQVSYKNE